MINKRILFVDDEDVILKSFCAALDHKGFQTSSAISGKEAIEKLRTHVLDVIVTDLKMPGINGFQVLKEAKKLHPHIVVIVLTGFGDMESAIDSLRLGADDFLHKPCDVEELLCRIDKCLKQKKIECQLLVEKQKNIHFEMISILAGGISHDYNNILTGIIGCLELVAGEIPRDSKAKSYLEMAQSSCDQAKDLTYKFNQISDMYKPKLMPESIDKLIASLIKKFQEKYNSTINVHVANDIWKTLIDYNKISRALEGIIRNAQEAVNKSGEVTIVAENFDGKLPTTTYPDRTSAGKYVKITIKDSGSGISADNIQKIFHPYYSTKEKGAARGLGLGLTLAAAFIRRCEGQIFIDSELGKGTAVTVFFLTPP